MAISIREFDVSMSICGAKRLDERIASNKKKVPQFSVKGFSFYHSGSYYIVIKGDEISVSTTEIMEQAREEVQEEFPGGENFWYEEIHTLKGLIILVIILQERYTQETVKQLLNDVYKQLLDNREIKQIPKFSILNHRVCRLQKAVEEFRIMVNPYVGDVKEPIKYLDDIGVSVSTDDATVLRLSAKQCSTKYSRKGKAFSYSSETNLQKDGYCEEVSISYYVSNGQEYLQLLRYIKEKSNKSLTMNLTNGTVWNGNDCENAIPVTNEILDVMLSYLESASKELQNEITSKIWK